MAPTVHSYEVTLRWKGNQGSGTSSYGAYGRDHEVQGAGKPVIEGSSDPAFRGDRRRWSPEELLVASLSQCHMLWYLHLASSAGIVVVAYTDTPNGRMALHDDGSGQFAGVTLHPQVTVTDQGMVARSIELHDEAHVMCFIAQSMAFPVHCSPSTVVSPE